LGRAERTLPDEINSEDAFAKAVAIDHDCTRGPTGWPAFLGRAALTSDDAALFTLFGVVASGDDAEVVDGLLGGVPGPGERSDSSRGEPPRPRAVLS